MYEIGDKVVINHREHPAKDYYLCFVDGMTLYEHCVATITDRWSAECVSTIKDDGYTYREEITFLSKKKHYELKFSL